MPYITHSEIGVGTETQIAHADLLPGLLSVPRGTWRRHSYAHSHTAGAKLSRRGFVKSGHLEFIVGTEKPSAQVDLKSGLLSVPRGTGRR